MSHVLLREMLSEADDASIQVSGPPWSTDGSFRSFPPNALKANVLCGHHNSLLSPLDTEGARLYAAIRAMTLPKVDGPKLALINGYDIERWMFKTLCGFLFGGLSKLSNGSRVDGTWFDDKQLSLIYDETEWRTSKSIGLYYLSRRNSTRLHEPKTRFGPVVNEEAHHIGGTRMEVCGLEFLLAASPAAIALYRDVSIPLHRPGQLMFRRKEGTCRILISWNDNVHHTGVEFRVGGPLNEHLLKNPIQ